jgi:transcriptional regulator with XRE-family HTH domain
MDLGSRITAWREAKGWTQRELAAKVGVTVAAVYQWESEKYPQPPTGANLERLAKALAGSLDQFFQRVPKARANKASKRGAA